MTISSRSYKAMADLVTKYRIPVLDHGAGFSKQTGYSVDAALEPKDIKRLEGFGYKIQRHEDIDKTGKERQKEVGKGNRFEKTGQPAKSSERP